MNKEDDNNKEEGLTQVYEIGYHIIPAVAIENLPGEVENLKNFLVKEGAVIISEEIPKMRELSFTMSKAIGGLKRKFDTAYFGWIKFDAANAPISKIKKFFDEYENILRFLLIKTVKGNTLFSASAPKAPPAPANKEKLREVSKDSAESEVKNKISELELDKSIDKLIAE
ncbi:MAG: 30S ribosomal protein S6 [Patescibacteria group bacterium]